MSIVKAEMSKKALTAILSPVYFPKKQVRGSRIYQT